MRLLRVSVFGEKFLIFFLSGINIRSIKRNLGVRIILKWRQAVGHSANFSLPLLSILVVL